MVTIFNDISGNAMRGKKTRTESIFLVFDGVARAQWKGSLLSFDGVNCF